MKPVSETSPDPITATRIQAATDELQSVMEVDQLRAALDVAEELLKTIKGTIDGGGRVITFHEPAYEQLEQALARIAEARKGQP